MKIAKTHVTIADIAREVGVSTATISRYLNGKYEYMSAASREKIAAAIKASGYRPSRLARGLKMQESRCIGLVIADITNPFSSILVKGVNDACRAAGYSLTIANTDEDAACEKAAIQSMLDQRVDGIIVHNTGENNPFFTELAKGNTPVVLAERPIGQPPVLDAVRTNDAESIQKMLQYMKARGYEKVGFFSEPLKCMETRQRRKAAYEKFYPQLFGMQPEICFLTTHEPAFVESLLQAFLAETEKKAILTGNGRVTIHVLKALKYLGVKYPEDVGLCSFDDWDLMEFGDITAIAQPSYELGLRCATRLLEKIQALDQKEPQIQEICCKMVFRTSV